MEAVIPETAANAARDEKEIHEVEPSDEKEDAVEWRNDFLLLIRQERSGTCVTKICAHPKTNGLHLKTRAWCMYCHIAPVRNQRSCLFQIVSGSVGSKIWGCKLTVLIHSWCVSRDSYFLQFRLWTHLLKHWDLWLSNCRLTNQKSVSC